jgi:hypothetical protein
MANRAEQELYTRVNYLGGNDLSSPRALRHQRRVEGRANEAAVAAGSPIFQPPPSQHFQPLLSSAVATSNPAQPSTLINTTPVYRQLYV